MNIILISATIFNFSAIFSCVDQCWIYMEAKEAVLGGPGLKGPPNLYK